LRAAHPDGSRKGRFDPGSLKIKGWEQGRRKMENGTGFFLWRFLFRRLFEVDVYPSGVSLNALWPVRGAGIRFLTGTGG
jgi:hypothetical protein